MSIFQTSNVTEFMDIRNPSRTFRSKMLRRQRQGYGRMIAPSVGSQSNNSWLRERVEANGKVCICNKIVSLRPA